MITIQKRKVFLSITLVMAMSVTALVADVPHIFQSNTVAKSSEININFISLDNRIKSLEERQNNDSENGSEEESDSKSSQCNNDFFTYDYKHIASTIGEKITIGSNKYIITAVPFEDFETKEKFYIKYPAEINQRSNVFFSYTQIKDKCYSNRVSNFPAYISKMKYSRSIRVIPYNNNQTYYLEDTLFADIEIKVNKTVVEFYVYLMQNSDTYTDNINWSSLKKPTNLENTAKTLLNYVEIKKMEN